MFKYGAFFLVVGLAFGLSGCGGSSSSSLSSSESGGVALQQFQATLPDGSPMELEILNNSGGIYSGEFAVAAVTGPYAFETGSFEGTITGNSINVACDAIDGTEFQMTGTANGSKSLSLTRSDIPGTVLSFMPVTPESTTAARADFSFVITTGGGTNGRATFSGTPYSVQAGGVLTEYRGTWQGVAATFWAYSTGQANIVLNIDPFSIDSITFNAYRPADAASATVTSSVASVTMYSTTTKTQFRIRHTVTAFP